METLITWDVQNCSTMGHGAQPVMILGHTLMPKLPAGQQLIQCIVHVVLYYTLTYNDRMLGFDDAVCAVTSNHFGGATNSVPSWMDHIQCLGSEEALDQCNFPGWATNNCSHNNIGDAGVVCESENGMIVC